jgi:cell division protein FtsZ
LKTAIFAVGGGASNALISVRAKDIDKYIINSDIQALNKYDSGDIKRLQIGKKRTMGLGCGADPSVGEEAALENIEEIGQILSDYEKIIIMASLGAGVGGGASVVIAKEAKRLGMDVHAVVSIPYSFEGKNRKERALESENKLREITNNIITIKCDDVANYIKFLGFKFFVREAFDHINEHLAIPVEELVKQDEIGTNLFQTINKRITNRYRLNQLFISKGTI